MIDKFGNEITLVNLANNETHLRILTRERLRLDVEVTASRIVVDPEPHTIPFWVVRCDKRWNRGRHDADYRRVVVSYDPERERASDVEILSLVPLFVAAFDAK